MPPKLNYIGTGSEMMPHHQHLYYAYYSACYRFCHSLGRDINHTVCLKLTLPSFYKFTGGLNRQVDVYLKFKNTFIFYLKLNASLLAVC